MNNRSFHAVTNHGQLQWNIQQKESNQLMVAQASGMPSALALRSTDGHFVTEKGEWVQTQYQSEAERGESSLDHNFKRGFFQLEIAPGGTRKFSVIAATGRNGADAEATLHEICTSSGSIDRLYESELTRRAHLLSSVEKRYPDVTFEDWLKWLVLAADAFVVNRASTGAKSVVAGYHWFADWGRDSLISLPGLTLVLGRYEDAKQILQTFSQSCHDGLVPNAFLTNDMDSPCSCRRKCATVSVTKPLRANKRSPENDCISDRHRPGQKQFQPARY